MSKKILTTPIGARGSSRYQDRRRDLPHGAHQFVDLASTQRELADELGAKFLEFCSSYLNEKCVIAKSEFTYQESFLPASLTI